MTLVIIVRVMHVCTVGILVHTVERETKQRNQFHCIAEILNRMHYSTWPQLSTSSFLFSFFLSLSLLCSSCSASLSSLHPADGENLQPPTNPLHHSPWTSFTSVPSLPPCERTCTPSPRLPLLHAYARNSWHQALWRSIINGLAGS